MRSCRHSEDYYSVFAVFMQIRNASKIICIQDKWRNDRGCAPEAAGFNVNRRAIKNAGRSRGVFWERKRRNFANGRTMRLAPVKRIRLPDESFRSEFSFDEIKLLSRKQYLSC